MIMFKFNIQRFTETVNGTEGHDKITVTSSEKIVYGYGGNDSIFNNYNNNVTIIAGAGNDSIRNYNGASSISIKGDAGNDIIENYYGNSVYMNGGAGNDTFYNISTRYGSGANATIISGDGIDKINHSGLNGIITGDKGDDSITHEGDYGSIDGGEGNDYISAWGNTQNVTINGGAGADTVSLTSSVSADIEYASGDGNDIVYGFDENDTLKISGSYSTTSSGKNVIVNVGSGKITLDGAVGKSLNIVSDGVPVQPEYIFNTNANSLVAGGSGADTIFNTGKNSTLNGNYGDDYIFNLASNISINGGVGNDTINATTGKVTINGGYGNDEIILYNGNALYQYATGDGNDTLSGFNSNDTLHVTSGSISKATVSGANVILTVGTGNITLLDAKNKTLKIKNGSGSVISTIIGGNSNETISTDTLPAGLSIKSSVLTASSSFTGNKINLADYAATKVNASALSKAVSIVGTAANNSLKGGKGADKIYGGAGNDTILGGTGADSLFGENGNDLLKGEAGNDTLSGGSGNDTLTGGAGNDVFIFSAGKDVITDYTAGDKIKIESGTISKTTYSGTNVIFSIGSGSLTVKGGKGKKITITDSVGNTSTKTYSQGVNAYTSDLFDDTNFLTDETQLSDITEKKYSVTQIQTSDTEKLAQVSSFLTFAKEK